jgi:phage protein U
MPGTMFQLGDYQFTVDTMAPQTLERMSEYRWPQQERILTRPVNQWVGVGKDEITFDGTIYGAWERGGVWAGSYQIEQLRAIAEEGKELMLVDGRGNIYGEWCITSIKEKASHFMDDGGARKQEFTITLLRQGEDTLGNAGMPT